MWDTAPLQSHYNTNKVRETEIAHGRQQMRLLADRLEQQSNPTPPKSSGSQRLPHIVSINDETDDDNDTTRRYVKSFRRILREHTDMDINYRTDEDGDPDFVAPPPKPFPQEGTIDQIEAVDLTEGTGPRSPPPPPADSANSDEPTTWHASPQHTPSPPPSPLPQTPEPRCHESSPIIEGRFSPPITPVTLVNPAVVLPTNEHQLNNDDRVVPEIESKTKELPVLKSSKPPLSVPLPMPVVSSPPRPDLVPVVSSPVPNLRHELPSIRPECLSRQCDPKQCLFRHCLTCDRALASDCPVDSLTCSLRCTQKDKMLVYLLSGGGEKDNKDKDKDKKRSNTKEESQKKQEEKAKEKEKEKKKIEKKQGIQEEERDEEKKGKRNKKKKQKVERQEEEEGEEEVQEQQQRDDEGVPDDEEEPMEEEKEEKEEEEV